MGKTQPVSSLGDCLEVPFTYLKVFLGCKLCRMEALVSQLKFLARHWDLCICHGRRGKKRKKDTGSVFAKAQSSSELSKQKEGRTGPSVFLHHRKMPLSQHGRDLSAQPMCFVITAKSLVGKLNLEAAPFFPLKIFYIYFLHFNCTLWLPVISQGYWRCLGLWDTARIWGPCIWS